jgi:nucleoside-diphosphate kinase
MRPHEDTLVLLKPDAIAGGRCGEVLARLERSGLRITHAREVRLTRALLARHYAELREKLPAAYARNARYMNGRTVLAFILRGPNAIAKTRALAGPTDPLKAPAGTIRGDLSSDSIALADAMDRGVFNLIHASDSPASARREIRIWFP